MITKIMVEEYFNQLDSDHAKMSKAQLTYKCVSNNEIYSFNPPALMATTFINTNVFYFFIIIFYLFRENSCENFVATLVIQMQSIKNYYKSLIEGLI